MTDFSEVLISPSMINDHLPDSVLEALEYLLEDCGDCSVSSSPRRGSALEVFTILMLSAYNNRDEFYVQKDHEIAAAASSASSLHSTPLKNGIREQCPGNGLEVAHLSSDASLSLMQQPTTDHAPDATTAVPSTKVMRRAATLPARMACPLATPEAVSLASLDSDTASQLRSHQLVLTNSLPHPAAHQQLQELEQRNRPKSESYCFFVFTDPSPGDNRRHHFNDLLSLNVNAMPQTLGSGTVTPCSDKSVVTVAELNSAPSCNSVDEATPVAGRRLHHLQQQQQQPSHRIISVRGLGQIIADHTYTDELV